MSWTPNEELLGPDFDNALRLRDEGKDTEAIKVLDSLIARLTPDDRRLKLHAHLQRGHIAARQGDMELSEESFRVAAETSPKSELASLGLFLALFKTDQLEAALREAVRFLTNNDSEDYRRMLTNGFNDGDDLTTEERQLADRARELLALHRVP